MEFRRGGLRGPRRRRALIDEPDKPIAAASTDASPGGAGAAAPLAEPARRYTDAALSPRQPRVIDLIPKRRWTNLVLAALVLAFAAGVEALYGYLALGHTALDVTRLPAINLGQRGSVATWFSSALLATSAVFGLLIYQIRRHRVDDYRGRYRMWCWVVPVFLLASVDHVAGIQESVRTALLHASGIPDYADAMLVWVASVGLITGAVGVRLVVEMRACRLSSLLLLLSVCGLAVVGATECGWLLTEASVFRTMAVSGLTMGAHIALLLAMFLYARHVHLDACGQVRSPRQRKRKVRKRRSESERAQTRTEEAGEPRRTKVRRQAGKVMRTDPPHTPGSEPSSEDSAASAGSQRGAAADAASNRNRPVSQAKRRVTADASTAKTSSRSTPCEPDDEQTEESRKLSKAERKRQRKLRRRERQP